MWAFGLSFEMIFHGDQKLKWNSFWTGRGEQFHSCFNVIALTACAHENFEQETGGCGTYKKGVSYHHHCNIQANKIFIFFCRMLNKTWARGRWVCFDCGSFKTTWTSWILLSFRSLVYFLLLLLILNMYFIIYWNEWMIFACLFWIEIENNSLICSSLTMRRILSG